MKIVMSQYITNPTSVIRKNTLIDSMYISFHFFFFASCAVLLKFNITTPTKIKELLVS